MNKRLMAYLRSLGLAADATPEQAWEMCQGLRGMQRTLANLLNYVEGDEQARTTCDLGIRAQGYDPETLQIVTAPAAPAVRTNAGHDGSSAAGDLEAAEQRALATERQRIVAIRMLAGSEITSETLNKAIDEGWSEERASKEFLNELRGSRGSVPTGSFGQAPAGHSANSQTGYDRNALVAAIMLREGINDPTRHWPDHDEIVGSIKSRNASSDPEIGRAVDAGNRMRGISLIEICRRALALDGIQCESTASGIAYAVRSNMAISKLTMNGLFSTSYSALMVAAYEEDGDTTQGWTTEKMVPNYLLNERTRLTALEGLPKRAKGREADHTTRSDVTETYKVNEYARQFVIDEQDLINDAFNALEEHSPRDMGKAAARLRPDLVYAILLANAAMSDSVALFHASHANLAGSAALAVATLSAARAAMQLQTENSVNLNLAMRYLLVPPTLVSTAEPLVESSVIIGSSSVVGENNPNAGKGLVIVSDARLENGVVDPNTGVSHAGSNSTWFGASVADGKTIEVGYIRELGKNPRVRTKVLDEGRFGISFDVQHSVGAKAIGYKGLLKRTSG